MAARGARAVHRSVDAQRLSSVCETGLAGRGNQSGGLPGFPGYWMNRRAADGGEAGAARRGLLRAGLRVPHVGAKLEQRQPRFLRNA